MRDQTRNIETFKVGASRLNEFAFHKHQGEMNEHQDASTPQGSGQPLTRAEQVAEVMKQAHEKVRRRKKKTE
jgi:hypothetical protein